MGVVDVDFSYLLTIAEANGLATTFLLRVDTCVTGKHRGSVDCTLLVNLNIDQCDHSHLWAPLPPMSELLPV